MENLPDSKRDLEIASTYSIDRPLLRRQIEFNASESDIVIDENIVVNDDVLELQEIDGLQSNLTEASLLSLAVEKETLDLSVSNELDGSLSDSFIQEEVPIEIELNEEEDSVSNIIDEIMKDEETLITDEDFHAPSTPPSPSDQLIQELNEIEQGFDLEEQESAENRSDMGSPHEMREEYPPSSSSVEQEIVSEESIEENLISVVDDLHDESFEAPSESFEEKIEVPELIEEEEIIIEKQAEPIELIIETPEVEVVDIQEEAIIENVIQSEISDSTEVIQEEPNIEEIIQSEILDSTESIQEESIQSEIPDSTIDVQEEVVNEILEEPTIEILESTEEPAIVIQEEPKEVIAVSELIEPEPVFDTSSVAPIFIKDIPLEIELSSNDSEELQPTPKQSFSSWLKQLKSPTNTVKEAKEIIVEKPKKESKKESKKERKKEAKNTSKKSSKKKEKKSKKEKKGKAKEIAKKSITERGDIISETLAELLATQGYKEKAIKMYGKLSHYYPEKSKLFKAKINELLESNDE